VGGIALTQIGGHLSIRKGHAQTRDSPYLWQSSKPKEQEKNMSLAKRSEKGLLTPDNCVVALIDYQPQMLLV
jgi:hypothetical protein